MHPSGQTGLLPHRLRGRKGRREGEERGRGERARREGEEIGRGERREERGEEYDSTSSLSSSFQYCLRM